MEQNRILQIQPLRCQSPRNLRASSPPKLTQNHQKSSHLSSCSHLLKIPPMRTRKDSSGSSNSLTSSKHMVERLRHSLMSRASEMCQHRLLFNQEEQESVVTSTVFLRHDLLRRTPCHRLEMASSCSGLCSSHNRIAKTSVKQALVGVDLLKIRHQDCYHFPT